jgi:two-component system sensor histidine kinase LytS
MSKLETLIGNKIAQNLFIWLCLFVILLGALESENIFSAAFFVILLISPAIYINNLFILSYLKKKKLTFFLLFLSNTLIFTSICVFFLKVSLGQSFEWKSFYNLFGIMILTLTFGSAIKISRDSFQRRNQEREAELKLLKDQLNPHFLFNTLNNLYGLSVIKSDNLPNLMLKLSDLLRYSLYETKAEFVSLEKEIQYIENYIALERIRLENLVEINFTKSEIISSKMIAPMLLIVFVENAFKHLGMLQNKKCGVYIDLILDQEKLIFKCANTRDKKEILDQSFKTEKGGIGLKNVKKRLDLLYPETHRLQIKLDNENYIVELTIDL